MPIHLLGTWYFIWKKRIKLLQLQKDVAGLGGFAPPYAQSPQISLENDKWYLFQHLLLFIGNMPYFFWPPRSDN